MSKHALICAAAFASGPVVAVASRGESFASSDEVRAIVAEMLADAESRSSLAPDGGIAGHDGRFFLASGDGNFRLQVTGEIQFRYYANLGVDSPTTDDVESGFQLRRARLDFRGHAIDPRLTYRILVNANRSGGEIELQDAYAEYAFTKSLKVRWGQFKLPFDRDFYATSPTEFLTIDRSVVASVFRVDRSQGLQAAYEAERWRITGAASDGRRAANTDYDDPIESDIAVTGRAEARIGDAPWKQFRDQTSFRDDAFGVLVGIGGHWQQGGATSAPADASGTVDYFAYTVDLGLEGDGWNVLVVGTGQTADSDETVTDLGVSVQGGVFLTDHAELFGRYSLVSPDGDRSGGSDGFPAYTLGVNWYVFAGSHACKVTGEITYYPEAQADSASLVRQDTSIGLLRDDDGDQFSLGIQVQIVF